MTDHQCTMMDKIEEIGNNVTKILKALLGDEFNKDGIVRKLEVLIENKIRTDAKLKELDRKLDEAHAQIQKQEERILEQEKFKTALTIKIASITGGAVVAIYLIKLGLDYFIK